MREIFIFTVVLITATLADKDNGASKVTTTNIEDELSKALPVEEIRELWEQVEESRRPEKFRSNKSATVNIQENPRQSRIVNGNKAESGQFPYQAGLLIYFPKFKKHGLCGGALISANRVLTAAHCIDGPDGGTVYLGTNYMFDKNDKTKVEIKFFAVDMKVHPRWNLEQIENDIGLIRLPVNVQFNSAIQPIRLPRGKELHENFQGEYVRSLKITKN